MMPVATAHRTYQMLGNESLWELTARVHSLLTQRNVPHAIVGGVAVCLHGYRRNTVDLDLLIRSEDVAECRLVLESDGLSWNELCKEFQSSAGGVEQFVIAGASAGPGQPAKLPNPSDAHCITLIEGLPVLSLSELIQAKLACGSGDLRRTHKDFADVVELITIHRLDGSFARLLHKSVQAEFRALVQRVFPDATS